MVKYDVNQTTISEKQKIPKIRCVVSFISQKKFLLTKKHKDTKK